MGHFWSWAGGVFVEQESKSDMISGKSHYIRFYICSNRGIWRPVADKTKRVKFHLNWFKSYYWAPEAVLGCPYM